jgi:hypothetical protein
MILVHMAAPSLTATTSRAPCLLGVSSARRVVVLLASTASEAAMGVGSAVCMMAEGARCVEDGLRRSARKGAGARGGGGGVSLSSGALVYLQNGEWGREAGVAGPLENKRRRR